MRELEFMPSWYGQLLRRRRRVRLQVWLTLAFAAALGLWSFASNRNKHAEEQELQLLSQQLAETDAQLHQMEQMEAARKLCRQKADALAKLGLHVESAKLIGRLAEAMPQTMALLDFAMDVEETPAVLSGPARAALKDPTNVPMERRLKCKLTGAAPTDDEVGDFVRALNRIPFLDNIAVPFARNKTEAGHILREFELTFTINLNGPVGS